MDEVTTNPTDGVPAAPAVLLAKIRDLLEVPPERPSTWGTRADEARALIREMDAVGLDGEALIRYGMASLFMGPILGAVVASSVLDPGDARKLEFSLDVDTWRQRLGLDGAPRSVAEFGAYAGIAAGKLTTWLVNAPFDDVLRLAPPASRDMLAIAVTPTDARSLFEDYRWYVDRLLEPNLAEWPTSSLHCEYRASVLELPAAAPPAAVTAARFDADALAHEIARRAATEHDQENAGHSQELLSAMVKQATMLLCQGRHSEAAALFEFLLTQDPSAAIAHNNLGFCLIPVDPERADQHLRDALRLGHDQLALHLVNRSWTATTSAAKGEVLLAAEHLWADSLGGPPIAACVWSHPDGVWTLVQTPDVRIQLAEAAIRLCLDLGRLDRATTWRNRLSEIGGLHSSD